MLIPDLLNQRINSEPARVARRCSVGTTIRPCSQVERGRNGRMYACLAVCIANVKVQKAIPHVFRRHGTFNGCRVGPAIPLIIPKQISLAAPEFREDRTARSRAKSAAMPAR